MYVRIQRRRGLITADTGGAGIVAISPAGDLTIELGFTLAPDADQYARAVRLTAYTRILPRPAFLDNIRPGQVDNDQLMGAIKSAMPVAKARMKAQGDLALASRTERITGILAAARVPGRTLAFMDPVDVEARGLHVGYPAVKSSSITLPRPESSRELLIDSIVLYGIDPGSVASAFQAGADPGRAVAGLTSSASTRITLPLPLLKHITALTTPLVPNTPAAVPVIVPKDTTARADGTIQVTVPAARLAPPGMMPIDHLILVLQALDDGGIDVDSVTLGFDIATHVSVFKTPKVPPTIAVSAGKSTATLKIRAGDAVTERVRVVSRMIPRSGQILPGYTVVAEVPVSSMTHDAKVTVPAPSTATVIYRAIPVGEGARIGAPFGSAVLRPPRPAVPTHASIAAIPTVDGLAIEVRSLPTRVRSVEVLRRDMTLHERVLTSVGLPIHVDDPERSLDHVSVVDRGLKPDHVYEHLCRVTHSDGRTVVVGSVYTAYVPFSEGSVMTEITDLVLDRASGMPDVTFTIKSTVQDTHMDAVRRVLVAQGVDDKYVAELTAERDKLQKLMVHLVTRVDLFEGRREDMGVVTGETFRDSQHRTFGAAALTEGRRYRYEVTAALRAPETMFTSFVKPAVDPTTRKAFKMRPSKWWHPYTLKYGTLTSPGALATRHAKNEFSYGSVGNIATADVVLDRPIARLLNVTAALFDTMTVRIEWHVTGDTDTIDHFLITQNSAGTRTVVGSCHSDFPHGTYEFFHTVTRVEHGPRTYTVTAVTYDLTLGDVQESEEVIL